MTQRMSAFDREMQKALEADGEKLRAMTGDDHGPYFLPEQWFVCDFCDGAGEVHSGRMSHSVNSATVEPPFEIMDPCPRCNGAGGWIDEASADGETAP